MDAMSPEVEEGNTNAALSGAGQIYGIIGLALSLLIASGSAEVSPAFENARLLPLKTDANERLSHKITGFDSGRESLKQKYTQDATKAQIRR